VNTQGLPSRTLVVTPEMGRQPHEYPDEGLTLHGASSEVDLDRCLLRAFHERFPGVHVRFGGVAASWTEKPDPADEDDVEEFD